MNVITDYAKAAVRFGRQFFCEKFHKMLKMIEYDDVYYVLSSIQFKYKILTNKIRLDCGTVLRSGRFLTHRHVSC